MLAFTMAAPSTVWADAQPEIDVSALRVSDQFAAKHPNGMFEVLSPMIQTGEGKEFDFYVLRRGGTEGKASVSLKAVEISAKYGEDFVLQEKDALGFYHDIEKSDDAPTLLEKQVEENKNVLFTTDRIASGAAVEMYSYDELTSGAAAEALGKTSEDENARESENVQDSENADADTVTIDDELGKTEEAPVTEYSDGLGGYTSALHKMRDEATGKATPTVSDEADGSLDSFFEVKDKQSVELLNDMAEALDGASYTMDFDDGEAYKLVHVKVLNDDIYETQEALSISLYDPTNGAELGEQLSSNILIDDDEDVVKSTIAFDVETYQVFSDADGVTVTLKREGNINDFVNMYISTLADTAKADEDYVPVMGNLMFMPGEAEKKIYVPLLKDNIAGKDLKEPISFEITAETEDNAIVTTGKTRVEILPGTSGNNKSLLKYSSDPSDPGENKDLIGPTQDNNIDLYVYSFTEEHGTYRFWNHTFNVYTYHGLFSSGDNYTDGNADLRGVENITWKWRMPEESSIKSSRQVSTVTFGGVTKTKNKGFSETTGSISADDMKNNKLRKDNQYWKINAHSATDNAVDLYVWDVTFNYTPLKLTLEKPDKLKYYVYTGTDKSKRDGGTEFEPGYTVNGSQRSNGSNGFTYYREETINAHGELSDAGKQYGCSFKSTDYWGSSDKNKITKDSSSYSLKLDGSFIYNYIYGGDKGDQSLKAFHAKSSFERTEKVSRIHVSSYSHGVFKLDGKTYNNADITSNDWLKGDYIKPEVYPDQGYYIEKINVNGVNYKQGDAIPLSNNMTINVSFAKDNNKVTVTHAFLGNDITDATLDENAKHGYVTGVNMSADEKSRAIFNDITELKESIAKAAESGDAGPILEQPLSREEYVRTYGVGEYTGDPNLSEEERNQIENRNLETKKDLLRNYMMDDRGFDDYYSEMDFFQFYNNHYGVLDYSQLVKLYACYYSDTARRDIIKDGKEAFKKKFVDFLVNNKDAQTAFNYEKKEGSIASHSFSVRRSSSTKGSGSTIESAAQDFVEKIYDTDSPFDYIVDMNQRKQIQNMLGTRYPIYSDVEESMYISLSDVNAEEYIYDDVLEPLFLDYINTYDHGYRSYLDAIERINSDKRYEYFMFLGGQDPQQKLNEKLAELAKRDGHIENLSIGDTVNLYAVPEEGYTCLWLYSEQSGDVKESDQGLYVIHVGDTFSFDVKAPNAKVEYYFTPINELRPDTVLHGRVIKATKTLRTPGSERVNINDKSTYTGAKGIDVTIGSLDPGLFREINGKKYYVSTSTDENGYFDILVPHGFRGYMTNLIMANGDKTFVKHAVMLDSDQQIVFELPFQDDNIWIRSLKLSGNDGNADEIQVEDKNMTATCEIQLAKGYSVSKVVLRSYNIKGDLIKALEMDKSGSNYTASFNAKEFLRDGGKLTVEAYDAYGRGCGAVDTGYVFTEPPQPANVSFPDIDELGSADLGIVGSIAPSMEFGSYEMTPEKMEYDSSMPASSGISTFADDGSASSSGSGNTRQMFEVAILSGNIIKNQIKEYESTTEYAKVFSEGSAQERISALTQAIYNQSSDIPLMRYTSGDNKYRDTTERGKYSARGGKLAISIGLDIGFYLRLYKENNGDTVKYGYDQFYALVGANIGAQKDFSIFLGPVPVYITLKGELTAQALMGIVAKEDAFIEFGGLFPKADAGKVQVAGLIYFKPRFTLGAGVGMRGIISAGVSGKADFDMAYQPWEDGAGTVEFSLNVDIDLMFIPISFTVLSAKLGMFYTDDYVDNDWVDFDDAVNKNSFDNYKKKHENNASVKSLSVDDPNEIRGTMGAVARGSGNNIESSLRSFEENNTNVFAESDVRNTLKHPKPQLLHLGNGKYILFYLGDDNTRADYDCQAVYYTVYSNGSWAQPQKVDDDGTADPDFSAAQAGDKVMLVYSDLNRTFGNDTPDMPEYLGSADLSFCTFDADGNMSEQKTLTKADGFANSMPKIAYNENTGRTFIAYLATDYSDTRAEFSYETIADLNNFINNSYSTVCYKVLDSSLNEVGYNQSELTYLAYEDNYGEGSLDNQRFVPLVSDTLGINEMSVNTFDNEVYVVYTVDKDGNTETNEDMELYASVTDISNNSSVGPIRLTENDVQDSNPQTVKYDGNVYLYWNRDGNVVFGDLSSALGDTVTQTDEGYAARNMSYNTVQAGAEAAQSFNVSMQPNGMLYLVWNALDVTTEKNEDTNDIIKTTKRNIHMRTYDPHYDYSTYVDEETGETEYIYYGKWGADCVFDEPEAADTMYGEQTFIALDEDTAMSAFRRYELIDDGSGGTKESPNADLVIHSYRVASSLDITDAYSDPEYPAMGSSATLHVVADNVGMLPSEKVTFKATMTDSEGNVTDLGESIVNTHLTAGTSDLDYSTDEDEANEEDRLAANQAEGTFLYQVPEKGDSYKFNITAYEDDVTENAAVYEVTMNKAPSIENIDPEITRTNNDTAYIRAAFVNNGNKATGDMTFKVSAINNGENAKAEELLSMPVASMEPNDVLPINEEISIINGWGNGNMERLIITLENGEETLYRETSDLYMLSDEDLEVTDILINDGDESTIELNAGDKVYPNFAIAPYGAEKGSKLEYSISDPDIADVDPSNGSIYGKKDGTATLTVTAVKSTYSLFVDQDDNTYDNEGNEVVFDRSGGIDADLGEESDKTVVMSKTVQVKVTGTLPETTTESTAETTTEPTTKPDDKPAADDNNDTSSRRSGGGSSSKAANGSKASAETDTESTTESVTVENTDNEAYSGFDDVKGLWCEEIVNTLHSLGIVNGRTDKLFAPDDSLTRAELVQLIANLSGADLSSYGSAAERFADVSSNAWYYPAVMWAADNNIVYGVSSDEFAPDRSITREEAAAVIYRYLGMQPAAAAVSFGDSTDISAYASDAVNTLAYEGIISGYPDNTFRPGGTITRAETASILYRVNER